MHEWADGLAEAVVEQLQPQVPDICRLTIEGAGPTLIIRCSGEAGTGFGAVACQEGDLPRAERARMAVWATLSMVQDWIARTTTERWPGTAMPMPEVEATDSNLEAWFGDGPPRLSVDF